MQRILPAELLRALSFLRTDKLCELRLRSARPVVVQYNGTYAYLSPNGIAATDGNAIVLSAADIGGVMLRACEKSLYAVNDRICQGYLTLSGGVRIGIAGKTVFDGADIRTIKQFTALDIRIPHEVIGCADLVMPYVKKHRGYHSTLIVSPPGAGKTTLLRDMARIAASGAPICNVLIVDERDEIASVVEGIAALQIGKNADVISGCTKEYAFTRGMRALRPDIIVTDELCGAADFAAVRNAVAGGVNVFASVHAEDHAAVQQKDTFAVVRESKCFARYAEISDRNGPGTVEGIYDADFVPLYTRSDT